MKNYSHAYLITGPSALTAKKADELCADMLCTSGGDKACGVCRSCRKIAAGSHPDVTYIERDMGSNGKPKQSIGVDQVREIVRLSRLVPSEGDRKVCILREAGVLRPEAQNAFLKLLEEPPEFAAFILCAESSGQLLDTVRSRCVCLSINGEENGPDDESSALADGCIRAAQSGKRVECIRFANSLSGLKNENMKLFVQALRLKLLDMEAGRQKSLLSEKDLLSLLQLCEQLDRYLAANVGVKHICGVLSVSLPGD